MSLTVASCMSRTPASKVAVLSAAARCRSAGGHFSWRPLPSWRAALGEAEQRTYREVSPFSVDAPLRVAPLQRRKVVVRCGWRHRGASSSEIAHCCTTTRLAALRSPSTLPKVAHWSVICRCRSATGSTRLASPSSRSTRARTPTSHPHAPLGCLATAMLRNTSRAPFARDSVPRGIPAPRPP